MTKYTNDVNDPDLPAGSDVTWTYDLANHGNVPIYGVTLTDRRSEHHSRSCSRATATATVLLDPGEVWVYSATGTAIVGTYTNTATATGVGTLEHYSAPVSASATDGYFGVAPAIKVVKLTNGLDNANPNVAAGSTVTWTYDVTNTGNVPLTNVTVSDNDPGVVPFYLTGDDGNGMLDPGETWVFAALGTAVAGQYNNTGTATAR